MNIDNIKIDEDLYDRFKNIMIEKSHVLENKTPNFDTENIELTAQGPTGEKFSLNTPNVSYWYGVMKTIYPDVQNLDWMIHLTDVTDGGVSYETHELNNYAGTIDYSYATVTVHCGEESVLYLASHVMLYKDVLRHADDVLREILPDDPLELFF